MTVSRFCSIIRFVANTWVVGNLSRERHTAQIAASIKVHVESGSLFGDHGIRDADRHHRACVGP